MSGMVQDVYVEVRYTGLDIGVDRRPQPFSGDKRIWLSELPKWLQDQYDDIRQVVQVVHIRVYSFQRENLE